MPLHIETGKMLIPAEEEEIMFLRSHLPDYMTSNYNEYFIITKLIHILSTQLFCDILYSFLLFRNIFRIILLIFRHLPR